MPRRAGAAAGQGVGREAQPRTPAADRRRTAGSHGADAVSQHRGTDHGTNADPAVPCHADRAARRAVCHSGPLPGCRPGQFLDPAVSREGLPLVIRDLGAGGFPFPVDLRVIRRSWRSHRARTAAAAGRRASGTVLPLQLPPGASLPPASYEDAHGEDGRDQGEQLQAVPERRLGERHVRGQRMPGRHARERRRAGVEARKIAETAARLRTVPAARMRMALMACPPVPPLRAPRRRKGTGGSRLPVRDQQGPGCAARRG